MGLPMSTTSASAERTAEELWVIVSASPYTDDRGIVVGLPLGC